MVVLVDDCLRVKENNLRVVLGLIDRGFSIFPCLPRKKVPDGRLVQHGVKDASRDRAKVLAWLKRTNTPNWGIATGIDGLFVVDPDSPEALEEVAAMPLPPTLEVVTSRGIHFYFRSSAYVPSSKHRLARNVDVKSHGGYVMAPGSIHPDGAVYAILADRPIAAAPEWFVNRLVTTPRAPKQPSRFPRAIGPSVGRLRDALASVPSDDRDIWLRIGMACHSEGRRDIWDEWSQTSSKFDAVVQDRTWNHFRAGGGITIASIFYQAKMWGWRR
jgi:putative DNA primase/helicase